MKILKFAGRTVVAFFVYLPVFLIVSLTVSLTAAAQPTPLDGLKEIRLGAASCKVKDGALIVGSGAIERIYRLAPGGLQTVALRWTAGQPVISDGQPAISADGPGKEADWDLGLHIEGILKKITATIDDDSGFTSKHIRVAADFEYAAAGVELRYILWIYPGSGLRTQLEMKLLNREGKSGPEFAPGQVESVAVPLENAVITAFGYYNDTERRDEDSTPILKEQWVPPAGSVDWANGLQIHEGTKGLFLVKESHKCVNQKGVATGGFEIKPDGVAITGAGLARKDLDTGRYTQCWASWVIPYRGDSLTGQLALKKFDRVRYPNDRHDQYIMANTWGSGYGRYAARQPNVLWEIASQKDLGIEVQQIDDGWQDRHWRPQPGGSFYSFHDTLHPVTYEGYPEGWRKTREYARQMGVQLGLWAAAGIPEADLRWNYKEGGFGYFKLDGAYLNTKKSLDGLMNKARSFVLYTHHRVRINWDVTENSPRFGYFYARELGNIFLENREPIAGSYAQITYRPYLVLRDAWQIAKYINLNNFQVPIQNIDKVNNLESDAFLHRNIYAVAIALMGSPVFFEETHYYRSSDRSAIRNLLRIYKGVRSELFSGYVFPIGAVPDNASWTGFQDVVASDGSGFLLIFRELHNGNSRQSLQLPFIHNQEIELSDLCTGKKERVRVDKDGFALFSIGKPADFRLYRYRVVK